MRTLAATLDIGREGADRCDGREHRAPGLQKRGDLGEGHAAADREQRGVDRPCEPCSGLEFVWFSTLYRRQILAGHGVRLDRSTLLGKTDSVVAEEAL